MNIFQTKLKEVSLLLFLNQRKKSYNSQSSYRGITSLCVIYKLFETVILNRVKRAVSILNLKLCHPLQNAYQQRVCSLMTSFTLQETVNHFIENNKLYCSGINGRLWRVLRSAYTNVRSCVSFDGMLSPWFDVRQSVREGGVLSAWFYVIFMNGLPDYLEHRNIGAFIGDEFYGCPMPRP